MPAGVAAALGVLSSYLFALNVLDMSLVESRTVATTVLILVGLYLIVALEASGRTRGAWVSALAFGLLALYVLVLATPSVREFFDLAVPGFAAVVTSLVGAALAIGSLWMTGDRFVPGRSRPA